MTSPTDADRIAQRRGESEIASGGHIPLACIPLPDDEPAAIAYAAYNSGGDPRTAGLNFRGEHCPAWEELPPNIQEKWRAAAKKLGGVA